MTELGAAWLQGLEWDAVPYVDNGTNLPHATHAAMTEILGVRVRIFRLSTGQAVIHEDDLKALLFGPLGPAVGPIQ